MATNNLSDVAASDPTMPDNITLRIIILAHGNRAEDDLYLVLNLDTTIAQLKQRIQETLSQHPAPDVQRLIYQGRPLLEDNIPLRQILRIDPRAGNANSSHVVHLVVRQPAGGDVPPTIMSQAATLPQRPPPVPGWQQPHIQLPSNFVVQPDHARIHTQLHNMQHHAHHARALANAHGLQHQVAPGFMPQLPALNAQPTTTSSIPGADSTLQPGRVAARVEETIGPNGERIVERVIDQMGPNGAITRTRLRETTNIHSSTTLNTPNPNVRPSSAPGSSPAVDSDPTRRAANHPPLLHPQPPQIPLPAVFPFHQQLPLPLPTMVPPHMHHSPIANSSHRQPMAWLLSSPQGPQGLVFAPGHGLFSSTLPQQGQATQLAPTPTVPLVRPHPTSSAIQPQAQLVIRPDGGVAEIRRTVGPPPPPQPGARPPPPGGLIPQPQPAAAPQNRQAHQHRHNQNDVLAFALERTWLFIRLYVFVFVLSEYGTWRRIIMLTAAIGFCLLPQNNPFSSAFQIARRHFDNLIGPPNIPQRQAQEQGQAQQGQIQPQVPGQNGQTDQAQTSNSSAPRSRAAQMPTPEEAARRLLEQQNRRNPNPVINLLFRIEQGVALFLASLVPGLGERHIQAREQARRILEEEERRNREESERQQQMSQETPAATNDGQSGKDNTRSAPLPESWATSEPTPGTTASSSGVDRNVGDDTGVRLRGSGA
ncbi:hypothetical protein LTR05_001555 [Lithohypha guttulata]|uniref:Ubiquitin-like domain-containing protein n=1 Tax=Lithohypha guttulata TaxID=1690604 RepID=A0AAN7T7P2_9EURO|nr:hypothetical protein LTR05_001555 [Lithohypha guttulata]